MQYARHASWTVAYDWSDRRARGGGGLGGGQQSSSIVDSAGLTGVHVTGEH